MASGAKHKEPTNAIRKLKIGMASARMKAKDPRIVVHESHVTQWTIVFFPRLE